MKPTLSFRSTIQPVLFVLLFGLIPFMAAAQPGNDACGNATTLTSSLTACTNTAGTLRLSGNSAGATAGINNFCGSNASSDVWYIFTAQSAFPRITLSSMAASMDNAPRLQLFAPTGCTAANLNANSLDCISGTNVATLSLTPTLALTVGQQYKIRVFTGGGIAAGTSADWNFNICIVDQPANDLCANATTLTPATTCINTAGVLNVATTYTSQTLLDACNNTDNDVWYSFTATSVSSVVTVSSAPANTNMQILSGGACGSFTTSLHCGALSTTLNNLTIGNLYRIRVYSTNNTTGTFNICVRDIQPNDDCGASAILLTSNFTCANTAGTLYASTLSNATSTACGNTSTYDVWFRFVAKAMDHTVTLSSLGSAISGAGVSMQLIATCGATPTSLACGGTTMDVTGLTPGTTYYIRVYATSGTAPTSPTNAGFNICVTHDPITIPPSNDNCTGAVTLQNNATCNNLVGSVMSSTLSAGTIAGDCAGTTTYDVWYKFTAVTANPVITLSNVVGANNFTNRGIQLISGTCGALTSIACNASVINAAGLTIGNTYFIRVYSTSGAAPTDDGYFRICVASAGMPLKFGNSYVNLSKKSAGGVVEVGDTLEIRMTVSHNSGTLYYMRYLDSVPTNTTMLTDPAARIRMISNEGVEVQGYTLTAGDDPATFILNPPANNYQIRMNIRTSGAAAAAPPNNSLTEVASATGTLVAGDIPRASGSSSLFAVSFRVRVTGAIGSTIRLGMGKILYKTTNSAVAADVTLTGTPYQIGISQPMSLCANATGVNMSQEFGGTFGTGTTLNRPTDLTSPIPGYTFFNTTSIAGLGDGQYSIVKNISPRSGTIRTADRTPTCPLLVPNEASCTYRMHGGHWDIDGDHTGTNDPIGNLPLPEGMSGGYMLMVNADYVASETYRQTINNLCPNTYYEFSAWVRNICPTCGMDYLTGANYTPTRTPGVLPNLTFALDGLDRYNTGEMSYGEGWVKKGFVFVTGPAQTSATFTIRNNSQGGGGNDWVLDDISVATCLPNMQYSPTLNPVVCEGNAFTIRDTIRSLYNNYTHHQWQRSTDGGVTWTDLGTARDSVPVFNATLNAWEYITTYTIPPANSTPANDGDRYRVLVATTSTNLSNNDCRVTDGISFISVDVQNCGPVLTTDLLSFNGKLVSGYGNLQWTTSQEEEPIEFMIDRSEDGINFHTIATVNSHTNYAAIMNSYSFTDPQAVNGKWKYRIMMSGKASGKKYSRVIQLNKDGVGGFGLVSVINPFADKLDFEITVAQDGKIEADLLNMNGRVVRQQVFNASEGSNSLRINQTETLPAGMYILQIRNKDQVIARKVLKKNTL